MDKPRNPQNTRVFSFPTDRNTQQIQQYFRSQIADFGKRQPKLFDFSQEIDLYFGLTTDSDDPIEVVAEQIAGMAVLEDTAFEDVTDDLLATLDFTEHVVTIDNNDLVVLLTHENEYVLLGDVTKYPDATVRFTYWKSETGEIPEASTLVLLGVGLVGLFGIMTRKHHNRSRKGGRSMKHFKILLFTLVLLPLLVGTAVAEEVELRVIRIGSGGGFVMGEDIWCGDDCKRNYEEGTVVHLKADPYPDSKFVGWLINDQPHEGVITIDQDTIVKAIFELKSRSPDELTVSWYNGDTKVQATMVLDEIAVFFETKEWDQIHVTSEEEFKITVQEIVQQFHSQATITEYSEFVMYLKSPEPIAKDQLIEIVSSLKEIRLVRQASPVFYRNPENPETSMVPTGEIFVKFPVNYTEEQILSIETEYGLVRVEEFSSTQNDFMYQIDGNSLEIIDVTNHLYESGQVEYAFPDFFEKIELDAIPLDVLFNEQWNFHYTLF